MNNLYIFNFNYNECFEMKILIKKILFMLFLIIIGYSPVIYFNVKYNPYRVFGNDYTNIKIEPNQRFIKMRFLVKREIKKDSLIFGSSRVGKLIPNDNNLIKDFYNMTYPEGTPEDHLEDISILLKNNIKIKNIIIGVDNISFLVNSQERLDPLLGSEYTGTLINKINNYIKYLLQRPSRVIIRELLSNKKTNMFYDFYDSGVPFVFNTDAWIDQNIDRHINDDKFNVPTWKDYYQNRNIETIEELAEINKICKDNDITLTVFINPIHITTYLKYNFPEYFYFLMELSNVTNYYDFSGINEITTNNYFYYETSHYRPIVGDMIIDRLSGEQTHFGKLVTPENVIEHIADLQNEIQGYNN